jgi:hypothetical protein
MDRLDLVLFFLLNSKEKIENYLLDFPEHRIIYDKVTAWIMPIIENVELLHKKIQTDDNESIYSWINIQPYSEILQSIASMEHTCLSCYLKENIHKHLDQIFT